MQRFLIAQEIETELRLEVEVASKKEYETLKSDLEKQNRYSDFMYDIRMSNEEVFQWCVDGSPDLD